MLNRIGLDASSFVTFNADKIDNKYHFAGKVLKEAVLNGDFSDFDFSQTELKSVYFTENSILPNYEMFFKNLRWSSVTNCVLPIMDLERYNIKGVKFRNVEFNPKTSLPKKKKLFLYSYLEIVFDGSILPIIDMNDYDFSLNTFKKCTLSDGTILPKGLDFFKNLPSDLFVTRPRLVLPTGDYRKYDFHQAAIGGYGFTHDSVLPITQDFFQHLVRKSIAFSQMPTGDYSLCDFSDVNIEGATFTADTKLPARNDFFQILRLKNLGEVSLPKGDYSSYDFSGVSMDGTKFTLDSILPVDLIRQTAERRLPHGCTWPLQFIREAILLETPDYGVDLSRQTNIPKDLLKLLHAKYKNNHSVLLPPLEQM